MTGWRLVVVVVAAFGLGWTLASWRALIQRDEAHIRMYRQALVTELNQDHTICNATVQTMASYIAHQEARLDAYAAGADLPGEVEDYVRKRGGS